MIENLVDEERESQSNYHKLIQKKRLEDFRNRKK